MAVGHGQFGGRSNLRPFVELPSQSRKDAFLEVEGGRLLDETWSATGGAYSAPFTDTFDGVGLDPTTCRTLTETLLRAESVSDCQATAGTYYGKAGLGTIYVHLTGGTDPNTLDVRVTTTFGFCTGGVSDPELLEHPILGAELATDPELDVWASATDLTNYTEDLSGAGWTVDRESTIVWSGSFSARLNATGAAAGSAQFRFNPNVTVGEWYRVCGYYRTPVNAASTQHVYVRYGTTVSQSSDGRNPDSTLSTGYELEPTGGNWRFFVYDFIGHEADARMAFRLVNGSAVASTVYFDKLSFRRIYAWRHYMQRLTGSIPEVTMGSADLYTGSSEIGNGTAHLANGDGVLERLFSPPWFFFSRSIRYLHGGAFSGGQEILYNDMEPGVTGVIAGERPIEVNDDEATLQYEDSSSITLAQLPTRTYNITDQPNGEERDRGRPRALLFGEKNHIRPSMVDVDGTTGYGVYEVADCTDWPTGIIAIGPTVRAYVDEQSADKTDTSMSVTLSDTLGDYTPDEATGKFEVTHDIRPIIIDASNNKLNFDVGGGEITASITPAVYLLGNGDGSVATFRRGLLNTIRVAMDAASGISTTITYSESTHKVTIGRVTKGTLSLLWNTGGDNHVSIGPILGFDGAADDTGTTGYEADNAIFEGPESHVIRLSATGYMDDGAGTYTGSAANIITKGPDVLRFILRVFLGLPESRLNTASFLQARTDSPQENGVYLGGLASVTGGDGFDMSVQDVMDRLENGTFSRIRTDGQGVFYYDKRSSTVPATAVHLYDRDFLDFRGYYSGNDVYGNVRVNYDQNPSTGMPLSCEFIRDETVLLYDAYQFRTWDTFLINLADAEDARDNLVVLARAPIRHFDVTANNAKLLRVKPGDIVKFTRSQALQGIGESGGLDADPFRVMWIRKNFSEHIVQMIVHTVVEP